MGPRYEAPMGLKGCKEGHQGNISITPVVETLHDVPWAGDDKYKIGSVMCKTKWLDGSPQEACPRQVSYILLMFYKITFPPVGCHVLSP